LHVVIVLYQFLEDLPSCALNLKVLHLLEDVVAVLPDNNGVNITHHLLPQDRGLLLDFFFFSFNILHVAEDLSTQHLQRWLVWHVVGVLADLWLPELFSKEVL